MRKQLYLKLLEAHDLNIGPIGYAEPYCITLLRWRPKDGEETKGSSSEKYTTKVIHQTLHPVWNEDCSFRVRSVLHDDLIIAVYDQRKSTSSTHSLHSSTSSSLLSLSGESTTPQKKDKHRIGIVVIPVQRLATGPIDGWFDLREKKKKNFSYGKIHIQAILSDVSPERMIREGSPFQPVENKKPKISLFIGTWNMGHTEPPRDLSPWLPHDGYDFFVIGVQECRYTSPNDLHGRPLYKTTEEAWIGALTRHFDSNYIRVAYISLREMRLAIFCHYSHEHSITNVRSDTVATGIANVVGNKGAVLISFTHHSLQLCFINCHLPAHQEKIVQRNGDIKSIIRQASPHLSPVGKDSDLLTEFHHVIWLGDLNYRLDLHFKEEDKEASRTPTESQFVQVVKKIEDKQLKELWSYDQLQKQMRENEALPGFKEGKYSFSPTFKVLRNKMLEYSPSRFPAWCDRVLWYSLPGFKCDQRGLCSIPQLTSSDHKPIRCILEMETLNLPTLNPTSSSSSSLFISPSSHSLSLWDGKREGCTLSIHRLHSQALDDMRTSLNVKFTTPLLVQDIVLDWEEKDLDSHCATLHSNQPTPLIHSLLLVRVFRDLRSPCLMRGVISLMHPQINLPKLLIIPFECLLQLHGTVLGALAGEVHIRWKDNRRPSVPSLMTPTQTPETRKGLFSRSRSASDSAPSGGFPSSTSSNSSSSAPSSQKGFRRLIEHQESFKKKGSHTTPTLI